MIDSSHQDSTPPVTLINPPVSHPVLFVYLSVCLSACLANQLFMSSVCFEAINCLLPVTCSKHDDLTD